MKKLVFLFLLLPSMLFAVGEDTLRRPISVSLFSNATLLPGSGIAGIVNTPFHPGFTVGTSFTYHQTDRNLFFQTVKLGYFYHRLAQHAIMLFSEGGYRHTFGCGFSWQALLGAGYLHSIPDVAVFEQNSNGEYIRTGRFGRAQGMGGLTLGIGYLVNKKSSHPIRLGLDYQVWFQFPFVAEYVPVLPNTALHLSAVFSIPKK